MSTGADSKTMPATAEFRANHERIYGDRKPTRGKWVQDPKTGKLIPADQYVRPAERAVDAPIMVDRFYENARATDGTDIGSRQKHREYMRQNGLTTADDYTETWKKAEQHRQDMRTTGGDHKERRETVGRVAYELEQKARHSR